MPELDIFFSLLSRKPLLATVYFALVSSSSDELNLFSLKKANETLALSG
jgi:hypothetical protein